MFMRFSSRTSGLTLMEVMMASAIFAVVIGITASSLTSFYVSMDIQHQRIEAVNSCRAVMGVLREKRDEFYDSSTDKLNWTNFGTWITTNNTAGWTDYLANNANNAGLKSQTLQVQLVNIAGNPATLGTDNPIEVHVITSWTDRQGHALQTQVVGILGSR
jgi:prepilin-type N-terminal cleavage/methylation domain-containing protein